MLITCILPHTHLNCYNYIGLEKSACLFWWIGRIDWVNRTTTRLWWYNCITHYTRRFTTRLILDYLLLLLLFCSVLIRARWSGGDQGERWTESWEGALTLDTATHDWNTPSWSFQTKFSPSSADMFRNIWRFLPAPLTRDSTLQPFSIPLTVATSLWLHQPSPWLLSPSTLRVPLSHRILPANEPQCESHNINFLSLSRRVGSCKQLVQIKHYLPHRKLHAQLHSKHLRKRKCSASCLLGFYNA